MRNRKPHVPIPPTLRQHRLPLDEAEQRRVACLLSQGMSGREIERVTGISYRTVYRFANLQGVRRSFP